MHLIKHTALLGVVLIFSFCSNKSKDYLITLKTSAGDISMILYDETPQHKENFVKLARDGYYDGVLFHRVINDFMIQAGDPNSKGAKDGERLGNGGPEYTIPAEFNQKLFHIKGAVAAARQGDQMNPEKRSSGSQFYIVDGKKFSEEELTLDLQQLNYYFSQLLNQEEYADLRQEVIRLQEEQKFQQLQQRVLAYKDVVEKEFDVNLTKEYPQERLEAYTTTGGAPHLDDAYTVFGQVVEGLDVVEKIAGTDTDQADRPLEDVVIEKVKVKKMSADKLKKKYDYPL